MKYNVKNLGKCLNEYTVPEYELLVKGFKEFKVSNLADRDNTLRTTTEPKCNTNEILFGINSDGSLTELKLIVDSSD